MKHIFGPVPSRRLGNSLGIDVVPSKTCTLNCIYCECGITNHSPDTPASYFSLSSVRHQLQEALASIPDGSLDYITFSGSGEPTLNKNLGEIIQWVVQHRQEKVAVITNSTLLYQENVREALKNAHLIMPTLCTTNASTFSKIHRPVSDRITVEKVMEGIRLFSKSYEGEIHIEIFFVPGLNDTSTEIKNLIRFLKTISFQKIYLNTANRPGTEPEVKKMTHSRLLDLKQAFPSDWIVETSGDYFTKKDKTIQYAWKSLKEMLLRRPVALSELSKMTGLDDTQLLQELQKLAHTNKLSLKKYQQNGFYFLRFFHQQDANERYFSG